MQQRRHDKELVSKLRSRWTAPVEAERYRGYKRRLWERLEIVSHQVVPARVPRRRKRPRPGRTVAVLGVLIVATTATVLAANGLVNLGKSVEVESTNPYFPLSGFHRAGTNLRLHGKPELLFIGTLSPWDSKSAVERWPVVKALEQFGTLSNARALDRDCSTKQLGPGTCSKPTFDWSRAVFRSPYLTFTHADVVGTTGKPLQRLSPQQLELYNRYARIRHSHVKRDPYDAMNTVMRSSFSGNTTRGLPLIAADGYLQTQSQVLTPGDVETAPTPVPNAPPGLYVRPLTLAFAAVHDALVTGSDPSQSHLVEDVNAEANIITALICHADGGQPGKVCGRPVNKAILKHVK